MVKLGELDMCPRRNETLGEYMLTTLGSQVSIKFVQSNVFITMPGSDEGN